MQIAASPAIDTVTAGINERNDVLSFGLPPGRPVVLVPSQAAAREGAGLRRLMPAMTTEAFAFDRSRGAAAALPTRWSRAEAAAAVVNVVIACAIVAFFHDRFWAAADDGTYAYIADAIRNGAVLNRDIHDPHGGYVHFVHALAFDLFGRDIVSLRYPLAALTVIQSAIVFALLRPAIGAAAIVGGVAMAALSFVQFLNPSANWYALFLAVVVAALLATRAHRTFAGLLAIGFAIGLLFLFRQLTGILVAMGAVAWLLSVDGENRDTAAGAPALARVIAGTMAIGLAAYLFAKTNGTAIVLYGLWPLALLIVVAVRTRTDNRGAIAIAAGLTVGAVLAALPLVLYHVAHGSLAQWAHDTTVSAIALTGLDFFERTTYLYLLLTALRGVLDFGDPAVVLNGVFWLVVLGAPTILGVAVVRGLVRGESVDPLATVALFHAVVSAHYAIPIYALVPTSLTFVGLLALSRKPLARSAAVAVTLFAIVVGLVFQAGQPLERGYSGIVAGKRMELDAHGLPGATIRLTSDDQAMYRRLLGFIEANAAPDEAVLGLPMTPQLNFLSGRRAPLRFVIAPLGLLSEADVEDAWSSLAGDMPAVVVFRPDDKYTAPRVRELMDRLRPHYRLCDEIGGFELYAPDCRAGTAETTGLYGS